MDVDITSPSNPKIKWVKSLHKKSVRLKEKLFLVEGAKEISRALDGNFEPHTMFICPELYKKTFKKEPGVGMFTVSKQCFEKIAYRKNSDGLLVVFKEKRQSLNDFKFKNTPAFLIVENIEKPGNLGSIIRTVDGSGLDGVIVCDQNFDLFNPNVIRASLGTLFTTQVVAASNHEVYDFLQKHEIKMYAATLSETSKPYTLEDFKPSIAVVLGSEHSGITPFWQEKCTPIVIPMHGVNDSLNVANAAAVIAYEIVRQRS